jgi:hypothetical protein
MSQSCLSIWSTSRACLSFLTVLLMSTPATVVRGAEGGSGAYVLGLRAAGAALVGPEGLYFNNQVLHYRGSIRGAIPFEGGQIAGRGSAAALVNVPTLLWMTPLEIGGARVGATLTVPFGRFAARGQVGPVSLKDQIFTFGDPAVGLLLAGQAGQFHWQVSGTAFVPIGDYRKGAIANIANNRASYDVSAALTWLEPTFGLDISNVVGVTFNGQNRDTRYTTGTEFHWEWAVTKKFDNGLGVGAVGYHYQQITADKGAGAVLGAFKGRATAVGASLGYEFKIGPVPVLTELRFYQEVEAKNRFR